MITVFYDGKCGLCRGEIDYYKGIAPDNVFEWIDITIKRELFLELGYSVSAGLNALHVRDERNMMHTGVNGFIVIWRQLFYWRWLAYFTSLPIVNFLAKIIYARFASWRFKKLGYDKCDL